jgi:hypothetical protein
VRERVSRERERRQYKRPRVGNARVGNWHATSGRGRRKSRARGKCGGSGQEFRGKGSEGVDVFDRCAQRGQHERVTRCRTECGGAPTPVQAPHGDQPEMLKSSIFLLVDAMEM